MQPSLLDSYIKAIHKVVNEQLPDSSVLHAKRCLIDYLGATLAGAKMAAQKHKSLLRFLGDGGSSASLIGLNRKSSLSGAALINGISSHTAELDDGVISGIIHPGAPLFSALLPMAQSSAKVDGQDLIKAIIAGYEASVRLANCIQPSHKIRGWHATATCGSIGAVFGIMTMRRAPEDAIKHALSAALVSASGSLKVLEDNSDLKPFNAGHAAQSAIIAVALAEAGFIGPLDAFSGKAGFLAMMADSISLDKLLVKDFGSFAIESVYLKPYAACRYCHPAIEAAIRIRREERPNLDAIDRIHVETYQLAVIHHDHTTVDGVSSAKMSIPFSTALALVRGQAGVDQYHDDTICCPTIDRVMKMVTVEGNPEYTEAFPHKTCARVTVTLNDKSKLVREVEEPLGDPGNPLTNEAVSEKFLNLADYAGMPEKLAQDLLQSVWNLPNNPDNLLSRI